MDTGIQWIQGYSYRYIIIIGVRCRRLEHLEMLYLCNMFTHTQTHLQCIRGVARKRESRCGTSVQYSLQYHLD